MSLIKGGKGKGGKKISLMKKIPQSKSSRAGLQFPVGRIHRFLKNYLKNFVCCVKIYNQRN